MFPWPSRKAPLRRRTDRFVRPTPWHEPAPATCRQSFQLLCIFGQFIGQEFQGDEATKFGVFGFVYDTHPAAADFLDDPVMRDGLPDQLGVGSHWREMLCRNRERVNEHGKLPNPLQLA